MPSADPRERSLQASIAAHAMHAKHDPRQTTAAARRAANARFEQLVDPDGVLDPADRARRAQHAKTAHFKAMALKSAKARRAKAEAAKATAAA